MSDSLGDSDETEFAEWYAEYPRKEGKGEAKRAYKTARKKAAAQTIMAGLRRQLPELKQRERQYIPHPATWLNGERWLDDDSQPGEETPEARYNRLCGMVGETAAKAAVYGN